MGIFGVIEDLVYWFMYGGVVMGRFFVDFVCTYF